MITRRRRSILAALAVIVIAGLATVWALQFRSQPVEPVCQGKPLTYWAEQWMRPTPQAELALLEIGPRAVPFLLWHLKRGEPLHHKVYGGIWLRLPEPFRKSLPSPQPAFCLAIPWALSQLGPAALPDLCVARSDVEPRERQVVHDSLGLIAGRAGPPAVRGLTNLLNHPDGEVRGEAAFALGQLHRLHSWSSEPELIPELRRLLNDPHPYARQEAAFALWWMERDTNVVTVLIAELAKAPDLETGTRIVDHFCQIGEQKSQWGRI